MTDIWLPVERALYSLGLWVARRRHGLGDGAHPAPYTGPQTAMLYALLFVSLVETVMLALLVPWPLVHRIVLVIDVYGVVRVLAFQAACVTRPHGVEADGSLRIRYGVLWDVRVPAAAIESERVDLRFTKVDEDGVLTLAVGEQTSVTVELTEPVGYVRPLGALGEARAVRFHADDPRALVAAVTRGRTAPSPTPGPPG
ncbi:hypothetical protein [Streptomyces sp. H27-C3]|uniref:hypothetical protein n=1 Tax=Streptomyces sp. H27-C3 TaxID=3046305 RepID=UPI0024B99566|nr:hypothetical protein [Streptomyces sp. H27-C3]MDJ0467127.1 hypothetical protein [Streptomyces sp. H27-C3]